MAENREKPAGDSGNQVKDKTIVDGGRPSSPDAFEGTLYDAGSHSGSKSFSLGPTAPNSDTGQANHDGTLYDPGSHSGGAGSQSGSKSFSMGPAPAGSAPNAFEGTLYDAGSHSGGSQSGSKSGSGSKGGSVSGGSMSGVSGSRSNRTIMDMNRPASDGTIFEHGQRRKGAPEQAAKTMQEFAELLSASGLMTMEELQAFQDQHASEVVHDAQTMAEALVRHNKLSPYQANAVQQGQSKGLVLGNYVISDKLGEGGMGMVFLARHRRMKRTVAIKVLPPDLIRSPDAIQRFHREVEAAAKLTHPNIAAAYDADESEGIHFLVMEHVDGPSLSAYVRQAGPVAPAAAVALMMQAARGLAHAHLQGIVHRDIKPGNLLVNKEGVLKILDMGLAQLKAEGDDDPNKQELTQSGRVMGTVDYMAPEQALDAKRVDHRADIYSLGCTLYYLLVGKAMSPDGTLTQKLLWHQTQPTPSLCEINPKVPESVNAVFQRMIGKKPEDRQPSMTVVCEELAACLAELPREDLQLADVGIVVSSNSPTTDAGGSAAGGLTMVERPTRTDLGPRPDLSEPGGKPVAGAPWGVISLVVVLLAAAIGGGVWWSMQPPPGRLAFQVDPLDADVTLDGKPVERQQLQAGMRVPFGLYAIRAKKSGFKDFEKSYEVRSAEPVPVSIQLEPVKAGPTDPVVNPGTVAGPNDPKTPMGNPETPVARKIPHERLLKWIFENRGKATVVTAGGASQPVSGLDDLPKGEFDLQAIDLERTPIRDEDLAILAEAKGVQRLSFAGTGITDEGLVYLRQLKGLLALDLSETKVGNKGVAEIARLTQLLDLNLQSSAVTDLRQLAGLSKLEKLFLAQTKVGDETVDALSKLRGLKEISLNGTYLTDEGYDTLHAALPALNISWDGHDNERAVANKLFAKGKNVSLGLVTRSDEAMSDLKRKADLPRERFHITSVDLLNNVEIGDADLAEIAKLEKVKTLNLSGTGVTEAGLPQLAKLRSLEMLDLGTMQVAQVKLDDLKGALKECKITQKASRDLAAAKWVLEHKGQVTVETPDGERLANLADAAKLPKGTYTLRSVSLEGQAAVTSDDLAQLADLAGLESLVLSGTTIDDRGLAHLAGCRSLRDLYLNNTKITSNSMAAIGQLKSLRQLYLTGTDVNGAGLAALAPLNNLTHLSLAGTKVVAGDLPALRAFPKLAWLALSGVPLKDDAIAHLARLTTLQKLMVDGTAITDAGHEELEAALKARGGELAGNPKNLERRAASYVMRNGGSVKLAGHPTFLTFDQLPRHDCNIEEIDFNQVPFTGPSIANVLRAARRAVSINLQGTLITSADLAALEEAANLESLNLNSCAALTDDGLAALAKLPKLKKLSLQGNRSISGGGLAKLAEKPVLEELNLSFTSVNAAGIEQIAKLKTLKKLDLTSAGQQVDDAAVQKLAALENLTELKLRNTAVGDAGAGALVALKKLAYLDLYSTRVSEGMAQALQQRIPMLIAPKVRKPVPGGPGGAPSGPEGM